jgi:hypothetical protein
MTIGRRGFLMAGSAVAGAGLLPAIEAHAAPMAGDRSVTEFGVVPNGEADQTKALQKAIGEIAAAGEAVRIPGGSYRTAALELPQACAIIGVPHQTRLLGEADGPIFRAPDNASLYLSGLVFAGDAIAATGAEATISFVTVRNAKGSAISFTRARAITLGNCLFEQCAEAAIEIATDAGLPMGAIVTGNQIAGCAIGISLSGSGAVSGNLVTGASAFGLRLGENADSGAISATNNTLRDCATGIGVTAGGETILAALNLITGARDGAIRAFDGNRLVGPDLALESAEAYLNLTVVGNVAR